MPPLIDSEEDEINDEFHDEDPTKVDTDKMPTNSSRKGKGKAKDIEVAAPSKYNGHATNDDEEEEDEEDEELDEDEFVIEKIENHTINEEGTILFKVKWLGYEAESDKTWEPEENLGSAPVILSEYFESVGGKQNILDAAKELPEKSRKSKKRGRQPSSSAVAPPNGKKQKSTSHPLSASPPISGAFKPPTGLWEDHIQSIDGFEKKGESYQVYLHWYSGHRTQHPLEVVYRKCPQKMLKFYEKHLTFTNPSKNASDASKRAPEEDGVKD